ncbi:Methyl-binding endonuclease 1 [Hyphodiscus hymeniophilus]|uniref:Methyl-binding endonuclease 1 n=1 Tax=Hyphodiscus hymeniophilus TaxID=353542 RepID=A0A9P6VKP6_9HELO|nr:Methyl-binding endonuclease 1 [Hyphodiscus hymeniophilus]
MAGLIQKSAVNRTTSTQRVTRSMSSSRQQHCTRRSVSNHISATDDGPRIRKSVRPTGLNHRQRRPQSRHVFPSTHALTFGLIQERIADNLYHLVLQAMLWNQTSGLQARPVFFSLIQKYPDVHHLAAAALPDLTALLFPLGLQNVRAKRCVALAKRWIECPPAREYKYVRKGYPARAYEDDNGFEIAHLPGVGPYALDSFRIFHRDLMRGLAEDWVGTGAKTEGFEPEWKKVLPLDKELRAYLRWRWLMEGVLWDEETGRRVPVANKAKMEGADRSKPF